MHQSHSLLNDVTDTRSGNKGQVTKGHDNAVIQEGVFNIYHLFKYDIMNF